MQNYLSILRDRWISALITAVLVFGAVAGFTFLQTPEYEATNRVFVQTQTGSNMTDLNSGVNFASQQITSYADVATTPLVLDPVIDKLRLDVTAQHLATHITTTVPPETLILEITATDDSAAQAAAIANATSESLQSQVSDLETNGEDATVELTVISPAVEPDSPSSPNIPRNIAIGFVLAVLAGITAAILRDLIDNRVRRTEDIERLYERPVIAAIPNSRNAKQLPLIAAQHPQSLQAEAYRGLRTNLQFMGLTGDSRSVLFTSSLPGEGKTSSAINLAHVVAQAGNRVLLVDADLRRPSIAKYLGLESGAGLTTVLSGRADLGDVTQPLETSGLEVLAAGPIPPNPSELLGSKNMEAVLTVAQASYDFIVIDTAPLLAVTDAVVLSRHVGGTVVVAQSERVRRPQLAQSLEKLDAVDARLLGIVLNRVHGGSRGSYSYSYSYASDENPLDPQAVAKASILVEPRPISDTPRRKPPLTARTTKSEARAARNHHTGTRRGRRVALSTEEAATSKPWPGASDQNHEND
ncbi:polysaccharide biosynthesis tyrosine autokinase [Brachybacterium alimentarium]|uniref:polysaccharide biosynthesis tyrosine autokinase n=1 Tax=Brachybacterium alimentarium TaxID=47845 RepID=UPI003FD373CD